jgi:hypothetical protein
MNTATEDDEPGESNYERALRGQAENFTEKAARAGMDEPTIARLNSLMVRLRERLDAVNRGLWRHDSDRGWYCLDLPVSLHPFDLTIEAWNEQTAYVIRRLRVGPRMEGLNGIAHTRKLEALYVNKWSADSFQKFEEACFKEFSR